MNECTCPQESTTCPEHGRTWEEALALLDVHHEGRKKRVHTFVNPAGMLVGADWDLRDVRRHVARWGIAVAGGQARAMRHGLVSPGPSGPVFFATREPE